MQIDITIRPRRFNSRTLGRVRRYRRCLPSSIRCFNSRTLGRVRRTALSCTCKSGLFQFTHPGKGATLITTNNKWGISTFQFTHPGKGATGHEVRLHHSEPFQFTHPGKGATHIHGRSIPAEIVFQFTHPGKGATYTHHGQRGYQPCFNSRTLGRVRLVGHNKARRH